MTTLAPVGVMDEQWYSGDSRDLTFRITDDGEGRDISDADLSWYLVKRAYQGLDDAVIDTDTTGVEIITDPVTDPVNGEFLVRVDEGVTADHWGRFYQVAVVDDQESTKQSWRGKVLLESLDDTVEP